MSKKKWLVALACVAGTLLACLVVGAGVFRTSAFSGNEDACIYLLGDDSIGSVKAKLREAGVRTTGLNALTLVVGYDVRPGKYAIHPGDNIVGIFRRLRNGQQEPVNLVLPSLRTMDALASLLGRNLMLDSAEVATTLADTAFIARYGYTTETLPALFVPNTYQIYWTVSMDQLMWRMQCENDAFWRGERDTKAQRLGLSREQVSTLASIVDEETANAAEKPTIAGLYLNRLHLDMPLQADPTVKFAVGDPTLRRILRQHLTADSPYNTYTHIGLPPGPIRIASVEGIDAVLNHTNHNYLYMCAKEDFSGTHNFAATWEEHQQNAQRYRQALNRRNIR